MAWESVSERIRTFMGSYGFCNTLVLLTGPDRFCDTASHNRTTRLTTDGLHNYTVCTDKKIPPAARCRGGTYSLES